VHMLTKGLIPKYQVQAGLYRSVGQSYDWMVAEFRSMALQTSKKPGGGNPQANYGEQRKRKPVKRCMKCGEIGHSPNTCSATLVYDSNKQLMPLCFTCREHGHMSRDCPKRGGGAPSN
jgi:hypothetical protein